MFAEDDYDLDSTTPSPGRSAHDPSVTNSNSRRLGPMRQPGVDFALRPPQRPESTLEMSQRPFPEAPMTEGPPTVPPPTVKVQTSTEASEPDAAAETTTAAVTATTTAAPDPDAEVCSGRPFDSFMQLKNGSIFAFRGERD